MMEGSQAMVKSLCAFFLAAASVATAAGAEPVRLVASNDGTAWSVLERTTSGWRSLLSHAHVRAAMADGTEVVFTNATIAGDGKSMTFRSPDITVKILARWLPSSRLPATVTFLPIAFARRRGVELREFSVAKDAQITPVGDSPKALLNGYQSASRTEVAPLEQGRAALSWWVTAVRGERRSFLAGFASNVIGMNSFTLDLGADGIGLSDRSEYSRLPVSTSSDGTVLDALYLTAGPGPNELLTQYAAATRVLTDVLDPAPKRMAKAVPTGWSSQYSDRTGITEEQILANADAAAQAYGLRFLRVILVDDGFQIAAGDWDANTRFPHGHKWLTDHLHAKGLQAGLRLAPFAVSEASRVFRQHPDWVLRGTDGDPAKKQDSTYSGGPVYLLDVRLPAVRTWLTELFRKVTREWGYDYVQLDFLNYPLEADTISAGDVPPMAGYRAAVKAIRAGCLPRTYLLASGAPIGPTIGLVDGIRIGPDVGNAWPGVVEAARNAVARHWMNGAWWQIDSGAAVMGEPLTMDQARAWAAVIALSGGEVMLSGDLEKLDEKRKDLAREILPVTAKGSRTLDLWTGATEPASVWTLPSTVSAANLTVAGLFNWTDATRNVTIDPVALGVALKQGRVHVWDIATAKYLGAAGMKVEVAPTSCRLLALTPDAGHPQLLGTDIHLTSGAKDILGVTWVPKYKALRCRMRATPGRPFHVAVSQPAGMTYLAVEATGASAERLDSDPGSLLFQVTPTSPTVRWVVRFG